MNKQSTFYDRLLNKAKDNKLVAIVLLIALVLSGLVTFLGSLENLAWLWPSQKQARIEVTQFTLNPDASPHFSSHELDGQIELYELGHKDGKFFQRPTGNYLNLDGVTEWRLTQDGHTILGIVSSNIEDENFAHVKSVRERIIRETGKEWAEIITGIDPVFDITLFNKGDVATVLSGLEKDIECESTGGDVGEPVAIPPIGVSHRYQVDIGSDGETPLLPPIRILPGDAARIQIQLTNQKGEIGWMNTAYILRLKFNFGSDAPIYTQRFSIHHGGGIAPICGELIAGGM